ncbi:MAG: PfkB family carbohydrate kinase [Ignavibacteriales bacterium]|nr:PfkB family carbohydrate kinase [Ignavibacteriales bacterium]
MLLVRSTPTSLCAHRVFPGPAKPSAARICRSYPGGKGANQAVAAARLGRMYPMLGRVGRDNFGDFLLDNLKSNSVDLQLVQTRRRVHRHRHHRPGCGWSEQYRSLAGREWQSLCFGCRFVSAQHRFFLRPFDTLRAALRPAPAPT